VRFTVDLPISHLEFGGSRMRISKLVALFAVLATLAFGPSSVFATGASARVTGGGSFLFAGSIPMQYGFSAIVHADGSASGTFHHAYSDGTFTYDFWGRVTCLSFDAATGRAWIGGLLTNVISTDPDPGVYVGEDAWFRVLDSPAGDRSTSMGFVGAIPSSEAYCAMQIWPDGNARTHPVTNGQITVNVD
jgi:hypothetical protein